MADRRWFARAYPKRLMAEVLADAIADVTGIHDAYTEIVRADGSTEKTAGYGADAVIITAASKDRSLVDQSIQLCRSKGRIGEILAAKGYISDTMARFFSLARVNERGEIDYTAG
jgi:threonine dehydrogenase-like Zn-dependent dehydrogenase